MPNVKIKKVRGNKRKLTFLIAYFVILTVERGISLAVSCTGEVESFDLLDYYMIMLVIFAIFSSYVFAVMNCTDIVKKRPENLNIYSELSVAAGILLLGGMVHTEGSIPVMQFISYGMILISMAIHTMQNVRKKKNTARKWLAFAYTVSYSMAIPVVYHTNIALANIFIPIECAVSVAMVSAFTMMLTRFYKRGGNNNYSLIPFLIAFVGDLTVLIFRWEEEINWFVLIFLCVTTALWIAGNITCLKRKSKRKRQV